MSKRDEWEDLTPALWADLVDWIESRWGASKLWESPEAVFDDFKTHDAGVIRAALVRLFNEGRQSAPSPSTLIAKVREVAAERGVYVTGPHVHTLGHTLPSYVWAPAITGGTGPGEKACSISSCLEVWECHCGECTSDVAYSAKPGTDKALQESLRVQARRRRDRQREAVRGASAARR